MLEANKKLGQNFLTDKNIVRKIIGKIEIKKNINIIEIGGGQGALTEELLKNDLEQLIVVEIDDKLYEFLSQKFKGHNKLRLINNDILNVDFDLLLKKTKNILIGNLPYNISTAIIKKTYSYVNKIEKCIFMVQKEVGNRLAAKPKNKIYGSLTVITQLFYDVEILFKVSPNCFRPKPKVDSVIVRLIPCNNNFEINEKIIDFIYKCFKHKRKTLLNSLSYYFEKSKLRKMLIDLNLKENIRAEEIEPFTFIKIYDFLYDVKELC